MQKKKNEKEKRIAHHWTIWQESRNLITLNHCIIVYNGESCCSTEAFEVTKVSMRATRGYSWCMSKEISLLSPAKRQEFESGRGGGWRARLGDPASRPRASICLWRSMGFVGGDCSWVSLSEAHSDSLEADDRLYIFVCRMCVTETRKSITSPKALLHRLGRIYC